MLPDAGWTDVGHVRVARQEASAIGRPDLTCPKMFRHGMATAMQAADVDPFVRKEIIGHTNLATTAIYAHRRSHARPRDEAGGGASAAVPEARARPSWSSR